MAAASTAPHARADVASFTVPFAIPNVLDFYFVGDNQAQSHVVSLAAGPMLFDPAWGSLTNARFQLHSTSFYSWDSVSDAAALRWGNGFEGIFLNDTITPDPNFVPSPGVSISYSPPVSALTPPQAGVFTGTAAADSGLLGGSGFSGTGILNFGVSSTYVFSAANLNNGGTDVFAGHVEGMFYGFITASYLYTPSGTSSVGNTTTVAGTQSTTVGTGSVFPVRPPGLGTWHPYVVVNGTLTMGGSSTLIEPSNGASVLNYGTFEVQHDTDLGANPPAATNSLFLNTGTFRKDTATGTTNIWLPVENNGGSFDIQSGTVSLGGNLSIDVTSTLTKTGSGALTIVGTQTHGSNSAFVAAGGATNFNTDAGSSSRANLWLVVTNGATVNFNTGQHLAGVTVGGGGQLNLPSSTTVARISHVIHSLTIPGTGSNLGKLDIGSSNVFLDRGTLSVTNPASVLQVTYGNIVAGFNSGNWNGRGITSSVVAADASLPATSRAGLAIGIWEGSEPGIQTSQATNTVLVAPTVLGDANGDQFTDNADYAIWSNNFGSGDHWSQGDFNYDQFVDNADFAIWHNNFGNSTSFGPASRKRGAGSASGFATSVFTAVTLSGRHASPSASAPRGAVTVSVNVDTGDVLLDVNLQGSADLAGLQFKTKMADALLPANYRDLTAQGLSGWQGLSHGGSLFGDFDTLGQTEFPAETVLDLGNVWNTSADPRSLEFSYVITPEGGGVASVVPGVITFVPEPAGAALVGLGMGLLARRRRRK